MNNIKHALLQDSDRDLFILDKQFDTGEKGHGGCH